MKVKVKKLSQEAVLPKKATEGSACYDICSVEKRLLSPTEKIAIHTGLAFELPLGSYLEVRPRSGLSSRGLIILNSPGTLDSDYRGELLILVMNFSNGNILINKGDRIAQVLLKKSFDIDWEAVKELSVTGRGKGGFGSTGR